MVVIYTQENHGASKPAPGQLGFSCSIEERRANATRLAREEKLGVPILLDTMDDQAATAYGATSARMYVLDACGRVAYRGRQPFVNVEQGVAVLRSLLAHPPGC